MSNPSCAPLAPSEGVAKCTLSTLSLGLAPPLHWSMRSIYANKIQTAFIVGQKIDETFKWKLSFRFNFIVSFVLFTFKNIVHTVILFRFLILYSLIFTLSYKLWVFTRKILENHVTFPIRVDVLGQMRLVHKLLAIK